MKLSRFLLAIGVSVALGVSSCKEDAVPLPAPQISFSGANNILVKPNVDFSVPLKLRTGGGSKSLVVNLNGGFLKEIALQPADSVINYKADKIPATAAEGDVVTYSFKVTNTDNTQSNEIIFTANVALYDQIKIGTTDLFNVTLPADGIVASGKVKLAKGRNYYIEKAVTFAAGSMLTIEEGVKVYLKAGVTPLVDVVVEGTAEIIGTAANPVVMTSSKVLEGATAAKAGDWGIFRLSGTGVNSNNGRISYLRIEYGGSRVFRLATVGAATQIDHVQVFQTVGEGIFASDGNARIKYLVLTECRGGSVRLGDAYNGSLQFVLTQSTATYAENDDFTVRETSSPLIANVTVSGPGTTAASTHGMRFRAASSPKVYNSLIYGFPRRGVRGNDQIEITNLSGKTVFAHSFVFDVPLDPYRDLAVPFAGTFDATTGARLTNPFNNNVLTRLGTTFTLETIAGISATSFLPTAEKASTFNPTTLNSWFTAANYVGAFKDTSDDWTKGWVKNPNGSVR
jgi:hypothetical protein